MPDNSNWLTQYLNDRINAIMDDIENDRIVGYAVDPRQAALSEVYKLYEMI